MRGGCSQQKKDKNKDNKPKKTTCPHCKNFHCKKPHQVEPDKCTWNKKSKGYHFKSICDKLKVAFKPRHNFSAELVGMQVRTTSWETIDGVKGHWRKERTIMTNGLQ